MGADDVDADERARVAADPVLRVAFERAYGDGAIDALRRVEDPEYAGVGSSPFKGYELARLRVFARGADERDRQRLAELTEARLREAARVEAALQAIRPVTHTEPALTVVDRPSEGSAPRAVHPQRERRLSPRRTALIASLGFVVAVAVVAFAAVQSALPRPVDPSVPPTLTGRTVITLTDAIGDPPTPGRTQFWSSGEQPLPPPRTGLAVALRCSGAGMVVVQLSSGERWPFSCTAKPQVFTRTSARAHPAPLFVFVPTTGRVLWSLRIVARPLANASDTQPSATAPLAAVFTDG